MDGFAGFYQSHKGTHGHLAEQSFRVLLWRLPFFPLLPTEQNLISSLCTTFCLSAFSPGRTLARSGLVNLDSIKILALKP